MVRSPRFDAPGRFHHLFNRAARRQVLFADRRDFRYFELLLACSVRRGELWIHAYCALSTHFHLLAASPEGRIWHPLMRIQNAYARYRNRRRVLDGPVIKGRFGSRPVRSRRYYVTLHRYISHNPCQAGLCSDPFAYPYSSARQFAGVRVAPWFDRDGAVRTLGWDGKELDVLQRYGALLGTPLSPSESELVRRRMANPRQAEDALDELYRAPPDFLAKWMAQRIATEGGCSPWTPIAGVAAVVQAVGALEAIHGKWCIRPGKKALDAWSILCAGLLHSLTGIATDAVGRELGCHGSTASRRVRLHRQLMVEDADYAGHAGRAARAAIDATFPPDPGAQSS